MFELDPTASLQRGMDVALYRHELLSDNLANLHVSNASRHDIDFESALKESDRPVSSFETRSGSPELGREAAGLAATDTFYVSLAKMASMRINTYRDAMK